jgi:hypothetical protein
LIGPTEIDHQWMNSFVRLQTYFRLRRDRVKSHNLRRSLYSLHAFGPAVWHSYRSLHVFYGIMSSIAQHLLSLLQPSNGFR